MFVYLGVLVVMGWWGLSFTLVYLQLRFLPGRVSSIMALTMFGILVAPVGVFGSIFLETGFGYPKFVCLLTYFQSIGYECWSSQIMTSCPPRCESSIIMAIHSFASLFAQHWTSDRRL